MEYSTTKALASTFFSSDIATKSLFSQ